MLKIYVHRGCTRDCPESTRPAFAAVLDYGLAGIELDVRLSRDGVPVVLHDDRIDRTSDGRGAVGDLSFDQLKQFDAGGWFHPRFKGERFLTFDEVLDLLDGRLELNIHTKPSGADPEPLVRSIAQSLTQHGRLDIDYLSCDGETLQLARRLQPDLRLCYLGPQPRNTPEALAAALALGSCNMQVPHQQIDAAFVRRAHDRGMPINALYLGTDANDLDEMRRLVTCGVDGLILDHAEYWLESQPRP